MQMFPGRTLEELDGMDWLRFLKAKDAEAVSTIEDLRAQTANGENQLSLDDKNAIVEHEKIMVEFYGAKK